MLNKILLFFTCFFGVLAVVCIFWINIQGKRIDSLKSAKTMLESNNNLLIKKLEKEHNDKLEVSKKIAKLEKLAKIDSSFDWSAPIGNTLVVQQLRENAKLLINKKK